ncbi:MAG: aldose 1-epimerase [Oliverpabstia sp.]
MNRRNYGCRITTDMTLKGNHAVVMENQILRLTILVDRGTDIIELLYKPEDIDLMWRSPVRLHRRAEFISSTGNSLGNYLDHNSGGWQEILPNGGSECFYKGACLGMHGEISNIPWEYQVLKDEPEEIVLQCSITTLRSPFRLIKEITLKENDGTIYISEELTNLAAEEMELMWGHHPTVGQPFLDEYCRIYTNAKKGFTLTPADFGTQRLTPGTEFSWPIAEKDGVKIDFSQIPPQGAGSADMLYLTGYPEQAEYEVYNERRKLSYGIRWDGTTFPYLWMWLVCNGADGYPWYGRTYNLALEPWTSYSSSGLAGAVKNGSAFKLGPGESRKTKLCFWVAKKEIEDVRK